MATLDEIRKRFQRQEKPEPKPAKKKSKLIERMREKKPLPIADGSGEPARKYTRPGGSFKSSTDDAGDIDGILGFSKEYKGRKISELAKAGGREAGFLHWILKRDAAEKEEGGPGFREDLLEIIRTQLRKC